MCQTTNEELTAAHNELSDVFALLIVDPIVARRLGIAVGNLLIASASVNNKNIGEFLDRQEDLYIQLREEIRGIKSQLGDRISNTERQLHNQGNAIGGVDSKVNELAEHMDDVVERLGDLEREVGGAQ